MTIGHDSNNLASDTLPLFTKDTTNLKQWADDERARIASFGNENNLDPSFHGARVLITTKKNNLILDTGAANVQGSKAIPVVCQNIVKNSPNQWFRLEKVDPNRASSFWYIRCDRDGTGRFGWYLYMADRFAYLMDRSDGVFGQWVISWEGGCYRIKNALNYPDSKYLDCWKGLANWLEVRDRDDTVEGHENQYFKIERAAPLSTALLGLPAKPIHLDKSYRGKRVSITNLSGGFSLDLGGNTGGTNILVPGPAYMRNNNVANTDYLTFWQVVTLEQVADSEDSPWTIKIPYKTTWWYLGCQADSDPVRVENPNVTEQASHWYIMHVGGVGSPFKIQNQKTKLFLEMTESGNDLNLKIQQDDQGTGLTQLFSIVKIPPLKGEA